MSMFRPSDDDPDDPFAREITRHPDALTRNLSTQREFKTKPSFPPDKPPPMKPR